MNIAFICDTAYQVLTVLSLANELQKDTSVSTDLYVGHQFVNSRKVAEQVAAEGLFSNVYGFSRKFRAKSLKEIYKRFTEIIDSNRSLQAQLDEPLDFSKKHYDQIFMSLPSHFAAALAYRFPQAEVIYFDDGLGSYNGSIGVGCMEKKNQIIYRLLGKNPNRLVPNIMYLNNAQFARNLKEEIRQIPRLSEASPEFWAMIGRIWDYTDDSYYRDHPVFYLTQPMGDVNPAMDDLHNDMIQLLTPYADHCLVRPHPRQQDVYTGSLPKDTHRDLWELVCAGQITDHHVLFSCYSTSQMLPKMFYDKEPVLIFYYLLAKDLLSAQSIAEMDAVVGRIKDSYRHPERIHVPTTKEELEALLSDTMQKIRSEANR